MKVYEKRIHSQNGEDGVIEHIFNSIGVTNRIAVEFGVSAGGGGLQTNTKYLADQGWKTFWFDIDDAVNIPPGCTFVKKMLTPDVKKRIGWNDLFAHPINRHLDTLIRKEIDL